MQHGSLWYGYICRVALYLMLAFPPHSLTHFLENPKDWVEVFDCNPPGGTIADRQLMTRDNVMKAMQTAQYIAICDDGVSPHDLNKCVFAKRGTEPFENLAKGRVINANRGSCDVDCLKQWWTGDAQRIGWMTFGCRAGSASDYTGGNIYQACKNAQGLHMSANDKDNTCGWRNSNDEQQEMPSVWIKKEAGMDAFMYGYV